MPVRVDSTLRYFIEDMTASTAPRLRPSLQDVLDHLAAGRGGLQLLRLLKFARDEAAEAGTRRDADRLTDAISYATGQLRVVSFERKYNIFPGIRQRMLEAVRPQSSTTAEMAGYWLDELLTEEPGSTVEDTREYFRIISQAALDVVEDRRTGRYSVVSMTLDEARWVTETSLLEMADSGLLHKVRPRSSVCPGRHGSGAGTGPGQPSVPASPGPTPSPPHAGERQRNERGGRPAGDGGRVLGLRRRIHRQSCTAATHRPPRDRQPVATPRRSATPGRVETAVSASPPIRLATVRRRFGGGQRGRGPGHAVSERTGRAA
ncbi:hypothetical protein FAGKG844_20027 [Frankia sp. AgKG'84/4]